MALTKAQKLRSNIFMALDRLGGKTRWVKGWELGVELPQYRWRQIRTMLELLACPTNTRWGWYVISKRGTGGGYRLRRDDA